MSSEFKPTRQSIELDKEDLETLFESTFAQMNPGVEIPPEYPSNTPLSGSSFEEDISKLERIMKKIGASNSDAAKSYGEAVLTQPQEQPQRKKTSLRQRYEDEAQQIQKEMGNIEDIRQKLGLSKRKICQLLMIDPSAWTRWTKGQSQVPPHIYRSLQWYMILQEKHPEYKSSLWLNSVAQPTISQKELESLQRKLIEGSKTEITKKAINYLAEEDHKRNKLEKSLDQKIVKIEQGRKLLFTLLTIQMIILLGLIFQWL